jgi:hypothetical protein
MNVTGMSRPMAADGTIRFSAPAALAAPVETGISNASASTVASAPRSSIRLNFIVRPSRASAAAADPFNEVMLVQ